jgi:hypothetical protein
MSFAVAPATTLLFAAAFGLLNLWLSARAMTVRMKTGALLGDEGNRLMQARMRAHGNFNEYVPLALILMALIEMMGGRGTILYVIGSLLVVGRVLHPFGLERSGTNPLRAAGILLTLGCTAALVAWAVWMLLHTAHGVGLTG